MILFAATLVHSLVLFDGARKLFRDSDSGWHIRNGETILASGRLPRTDPYSFSRPGEPWFAWEWGMDLAMGWTHRHGGLAGVAGLYSLLLAVCSWLWIRLHWMAGSGFFVAALLGAPMLATTSLHWLARPHVAGWLLSLVALAICLSGRLRFVELALLAIAWANLHASFFLLPVMLGVWAAGSVLRAVLWAAPGAWASAAAFSGGAAVALLATFVNPYGWHLHEHVIRYLADEALLQHVAEFQSFNFHLAGSGWVVAVVVLIAAAIAPALAQGKCAEALFLGLLVVFALRSARGLPVAALLGLPLAGGILTEAVRSWSGLRPAAKGWIESALQYGDRLRTLDAGCGGWAVGFVLAAAAILLLETPANAARAGFSAEDFPVAAARVMEGLPPEARVMAPDKFGGYLIYRFEGRRKVFFDGRSDFYGAVFLLDYLTMVEARPSWQAKFQRYRFTHALLPTKSPLLAALEQAGWRRLYGDEVAVLLER